MKSVFQDLLTFETLCSKLWIMCPMESVKSFPHYINSRDEVLIHDKHLQYVLTRVISSYPVKKSAKNLSSEMDVRRQKLLQESSEYHVHEYSFYSCKITLNVRESFWSIKRSSRIGPCISGVSLWPKISCSVHGHWRVSDLRRHQRDPRRVVVSRKSFKYWSHVKVQIRRSNRRLTRIVIMDSRIFSQYESRNKVFPLVSILERLRRSSGISNRL